MGDLAHVSDQYGVLALDTFGDQLLLDVPEVEGGSVHCHPLARQLEVVQLISVVFVGDHFFCRIAVSSLPEYNRGVGEQCSNPVTLGTVRH